jgi:hypothetical protein
MRRLAAVAALGIAFPAGIAILGAASASAATTQARTLAGSCSFSGPITPKPPITIVPKPGEHFDYAGTGSCDGTFAGGSVQKLPITVTVTNVETAFDTCELGPDFNLHGILAVEQGAVTTDFPITINLARLALFGPLTLTTPGGGSAFGTAQFEPANAVQAIQQCVSTGVATATLAGSFQTTAPLVGSVVTPPPKARPQRTRAHRAHRQKHRRKRTPRHRR